MSSSENPKDPGQLRNDEDRFIAYETNRVPWYIHVMWATFAVAGIVYLLRNALSDFLLWW